jgi:hypothetical protein
VARKSFLAADAVCLFFLSAIGSELALAQVSGSSSIRSTISSELQASMQREQRVISIVRSRSVLAPAYSAFRIYAPSGSMQALLPPDSFSEVAFASLPPLEPRDPEEIGRLVRVAYPNAPVALQGRLAAMFGDANRRLVEADRALSGVPSVDFRTQRVLKKLQRETMQIFFDGEVAILNAADAEEQLDAVNDLEDNVNMQMIRSQAP